MIVDRGSNAGWGVEGITSLLVAGPYRWEAHDLRGYGVQTNRFTFGAYRAPGAPTAAFALESLLDELAQKLELDPIELRLQNAVVEGDVGDQRQPVPDDRRRRGPRADPRAPALGAQRDSLPEGEGIGMAAGYWPGGNEPAAAVCRVDTDGTMTVVTSAADMSGVNTGFAVIAAAAFGLSPDKVRVVTADTATGPYAGASGGSKVTYTVGTAVLRAAERRARSCSPPRRRSSRSRPTTSRSSTASSARSAHPTARSRSRSSRSKALRFGGRYEPIEGHGGSAQTRGAPSVAAHLSHVRVDRETGEVELLRHVIAQDVGRALNPALVEGQMRGGATQGIGWALFEQLDHDEDGQPAHGLVPRLRDPDRRARPGDRHAHRRGARARRAVRREGHRRGARGRRAAPAIANAVAAATGTRLHELPMTPPRVWAALPEAA